MRFVCVNQGFPVILVVISIALHDAQTMVLVRTVLVSVTRTGMGIHAQIS